MSNGRRMSGGLFQGMNKNSKANPVTVTKDPEEIIKAGEKNTESPVAIKVPNEPINSVELKESNEEITEKNKLIEVEESLSSNLIEKKKVPKWQRRNNVGIRLEKVAIKNLTFWAKEVTMSRDEGEERITTSSFVTVLINILNDSEKYLDLNHISTEKDLEDRVRQAFKLQFNKK